MVGGGAVFVRQTAGFSFQIFRWVMTPDPDFLMGGSDLFTTAMVWGGVLFIWLNYDIG